MAVILYTDIIKLFFTHISVINMDISLALTSRSTFLARLPIKRMSNDAFQTQCGKALNAYLHVFALVCTDPFLGSRNDSVCIVILKGLTSVLRVLGGLVTENVFL